MSTPHRGIGAFPSGGLGQTARGKNYLLVIGIDRYEHFPVLNNAVRDAQTFAALLQERYLFDAPNTEVLFNEQATERQLLFKLRDMARLVTPDDNLVIYFSGHGEFDDILNEGYWIPVDAERDAMEDYIPNSKIHTVLNAIRSRHTFLIVDSCFSGTLFMQFRSGSAGDRLEILPSRWGLTSGRNEIVPDGPSGHHSPFAEALLNQLKLSPGDLSVGELCQRVVESVAARSSQIPRGEPLRVNGHEGGQFFFRLRQTTATADTAPPDKPSQPSKGSLLYSIPETMEVGQESRCEVRIAFDKAVLLEDFDTEKAHEIRDIRISNLMQVELMDPLAAADPALSLRTISSAEQFIDPDDYTQWIFYVKALREGVHPLVLKVTVIETMAGKERRREIVLEEQIEVRTQLSQQPEGPGFTRGYSFEMQQKKGSALEGLEPPAPQIPVQPAFEPVPPQAKRRSIGWVRTLAAVMVLLLGVMVVFRWIVSPSSTGNIDSSPMENIRANKERLSEAREMLEKEDPDLPKAEELLEKARESMKEEPALPDSLSLELREIEELLIETRRRKTMPSPQLDEELREVAPSRDQLADRIRSGDDAGPKLSDLELFTDQRDGKQYQALPYDGRFWLQRSMAYENGGMICYNGQALLCQNLGGLYTWEAARSACPKGWHLPSPGEWDALLAQWGGYDSEKAYQALSYGGGSFFQAQLGGMQAPGGEFSGLYQKGYFWTSGPAAGKTATAIVFDKEKKTIRKMAISKEAKLSCRCVRD
jgi:uncharacterized protein (TIGR02145 family)